MANENRVKLLWDYANTLRAEGHTQQLLKSVYMTRCRKAARNTLQMPKEKLAASKMCSRCSSSWNDVDFRMTLKPQPIVRSSKARKLISKLEESRTAPDKRKLLSRKQRKRAKWLQKRVFSNVEIECELCHHKTHIPLEKPDKKKESRTEEPVAAEKVLTVIPLKTKKKKTKSKDKTAGLKLNTLAPPAVISSHAKPQKKAVPSVTEVIQKPQLNTKTQTKKPAPSISANLSQSLKAKKKSKKATKAAATPITPKMQSKTQQQNSLLKLAALLKTKSAKPSKNAAQQRLEALLK